MGEEIREKEMRSEETEDCLVAAGRVRSTRTR